MLRQVAISLLFYFIDVQQVIEQPLSSLLNHAGLVKRMMRACHLEMVVTWSGSFGAPSPKPLKLWSTNDFVHGLRRSRPLSCSDRLAASRLVTDQSGKCRRTVTGLRAKLRRSSAYPPMLCAAAADLMVP